MIQIVALHCHVELSCHVKKSNTSRTLQFKLIVDVVIILFKILSSEVLREKKLIRLLVRTNHICSTFVLIVGIFSFIKPKIIRLIAMLSIQQQCYETSRKVNANNLRVDLASVYQSWILVTIGIILVIDQMELHKMTP